MLRTRRVHLWGAASILGIACGGGPEAVADGAPTAGAEPQVAVANDNRSPAGTLSEGVLELRLEARLATWRPDEDVDTTVTVMAFAEEGRPPSIPGPLVRVPQGTEVRVTLRSSIPDSVRIGFPPPGQRDPGMSPLADSVLVVHGLRAGAVADDTLHLRPGAVREVRFRAGEPGTYAYWGSATSRAFDARTGRDAQLAGAIVIDPPGASPDPDERIFVITMIDILPDSAQPPPHEDIFELAINGRSWPHTERLRYPVGDTVRWRWINSSFSNHPMHLHGFHFRVLARGDGARDTTYAPEAIGLAVTENMPPGGTFRMDWLPARPGNWLMHCHIAAHIVPFPERDSEARAHDVHDVAAHPLSAMAGLVMGITVTDPAGASAALLAPDRRLRLLAQERRADATGPSPRGFVLQEGAEPPLDSVAIPGPPLVLTRGETTAITVLNRLREPTTVHWHGMELESVFDGVSGWSRTGPRIAPLIEPGDSFTVRLTPPRAGTFIYHTHMDETDQLGSGLYGPLLVLAPGNAFEPSVDHVFILGEAVLDGARTVAINGRREPAPVTLRTGVEHRLRLINIQPDATAEITLSGGADPLRWLTVAKDGADLPPPLRGEEAARVRLGVGETYDVLWRPERSGEALLAVRVPGLTEAEEVHLRQVLRVR